jgi:hypothetical protein
MLTKIYKHTVALHDILVILFLQGVLLVFVMEETVILLICVLDEKETVLKHTATMLKFNMLKLLHTNSTINRKCQWNNTYLNKIL